MFSHFIFFLSLLFFFLSFFPHIYLYLNFIHNLLQILRAIIKFVCLLLKAIIKQDEESSKKRKRKQQRRWCGGATCVIEKTVYKIARGFFSKFADNAVVSYGVT